MVIHAFPSIERCKQRSVQTGKEGGSNIYPCLSEHRKMQARLDVVGDIKDQGRNELKLSTLILASSHREEIQTRSSKGLKNKRIGGCIQ